MKKFTLDGDNYECDDRFTFFAKDEDGRVWVYTGEPFIREEDEGWDTEAGDVAEVYRVKDSGVSWRESMGEIK